MKNAAFETEGGVFKDRGGKPFYSGTPRISRGRSPTTPMA